MPKEWSKKRERQYEHIKAGLEERGRNEDTAEDISSGRRGGLRSHQGAGGRTKAQLYEEAKKQNVQGRSSMSKAELEKAVDR